MTDADTIDLEPVPLRLTPLEQSLRRDRDTMPEARITRVVLATLDGAGRHSYLIAPSRGFGYFSRTVDVCAAWQFNSADEAEATLAAMPAHFRERLARERFRLLDFRGVITLTRDAHQAPCLCAECSIWPPATGAEAAEFGPRLDIERALAIAERHGPDAAYAVATGGAER